MNFIHFLTDTRAQLDVSKRGEAQSDQNAERDQRDWFFPQCRIHGKQHKSRGDTEVPQGEKSMSKFERRGRDASRQGTEISRAVLL